MLRAIQTLRIHLLELEKVNELCRDFCTRYITCLRAKMQNEQLLHLDSFDGECVGGNLMMAGKSMNEMKTDEEDLPATVDERNRSSSDCYQPSMVTVGFYG